VTTSRLDCVIFPVYVVSEIVTGPPSFSAPLLIDADRLSTAVEKLGGPVTISDTTYTGNITQSSLDVVNVGPKVNGTAWEALTARSPSMVIFRFSAPH